jgi:uncharacterized membrane protein
MTVQDSGNRLRTIATLQAVALVVVAASFWQTVAAYPALPHTMAVHWSVAGQADGWAAKSWGKVLLLPLIQAGTCLVLAGMSFWVAFSPGALAYVNLPIDKSGLSDEQSLQVRLLTAQGMSVINLLVLATLTYLNYVILRAAGSDRGPGSAATMVTVLAGTAGILVTVTWLIRAVRRTARS